MGMLSCRFMASRLKVSMHSTVPNTAQSQLPLEGFVRIKQIIAPNGPIPVSKSTWWAGVKSGRFPKPVRIFGPRITVWNVKEIRALIEL